MPYCPECGEEVPAEAVFCSNCGSSLGETADDTQQAGGEDWSEEPQSGGDDGWSDEPPTAGGEGWSDEPPTAGQEGWNDTGGANQRGTGQPNAGQPGQPGHGGQPQAGQPRGGQQRGAPGAPGQPQGRAHQQQQQGTRIEDGKVNYAFKFPYSGGFGPVIAGGASLLFGFLIVPFFLYFGYIFRLTGAASRGERVQPAFDDIGGLIVDGLKYALVAAAWGIILVIVFLLPLVISAGGAAGLENPGSAGGAVALGVLIAFGGLLFVAYLLPAVLTLYAATDDVSVAFSPGRIAEFAFTGKYFISYLLFLALNFALQMAVSIVFFILAITVVGILLMFPINAYLQYFAASFWGGAYWEAVNEGIVTPPEGAQGPQQPQQAQQHQQAQPGQGQNRY